MNFKFKLGGRASGRTCPANMRSRDIHNRNRAVELVELVLSSGCSHSGCSVFTVRFHTDSANAIIQCHHPRPFKLSSPLGRSAVSLTYATPETAIYASEISSVKTRSFVCYQFRYSSAKLTAIDSATWNEGMNVCSTWTNAFLPFY